MNDPVKFFRNFLFGFIVIATLGTTVAIYQNVIADHFLLPEYVVPIIKTLLTYALILSTIFIPVLICLDRKSKFKEQIGLDVSTKYLKPGNFGIENYTDEAHYINRQGDKDIEKLLENGKHVLILGQSKIGKTSAAFRACKKLKDFIVIKPKTLFETKHIPYPFFVNRNFILFLDESELYNGRLIKELKEYLKNKSRKLIVVATCCSGNENEAFEKQSALMGIEFNEVTLDCITEKDGINLARAIGRDWNKIRFDGTPGCITLKDSESGLKRIKIKYNEAGNGRYILKTIKLLKEGGLNFYGMEFYETELVKETCEKIFGLSIREYEWLDAIRYLADNLLIKFDDNYIKIRDSYLDYCVDEDDFNPLEKYFDSLREIVFAKRRLGYIVGLGYGYLHRKYFTDSKECFEFALDIQPKSTSALNGLGSLFIGLGKENRSSEESKNNFAEAVMYLEKSKSIRSIASTHRKLGYAYGLLKDYENAECEYRKSLQIEERSVFTHNLLGRLLIEKSDFDEAKNELRRAIDINPYYALAHHNLGILFSKLGDYKNAIEEFDRALKLNDSYAEVYLSKGLALFNQGNLSEAKSSFTRAIEINPDNESFHFYLGFLLSKLGEMSKAIEEYKKATEINPNHFQAQANLGFLLVDLNKYDKAEKPLKEAVRINPRNSLAHCNLGFCLKLAGKINEAENEIRQAISLDRNLPQTHKQLACLLAVKNNEEAKREAENEFRRVVELTPNDPVAHRDLAYFLENNTKNDDEIEREYKKALDLNPSYVAALNDYGCLLRKGGRPKEAEDKHRKAIEIDDNSALLHNNLALDLRAQDKKMEAIHEFEKALKINPEYMEVYPSLGYTFTELKKNKEATRIYRKAYELKPDFEDIAIKYAIAAERTETPDEVLRIYNKVFETQFDNINLIKTFTQYLYNFRHRIDVLGIIDKMIQINPKVSIRDNPNILALKGEILRRRGEFKIAEECTRRVIDLDQENIVANKNYAILKELAGDGEQNDQDRLKFYNIAEKFYKKVLSLEPDHPSAHRHLGNLLAKLKGRDREAEDEYNAIKTKRPYPEKHRDYGIFLLDRDKIEEGKRELEIAIDLFRKENDDIEVQKCKDILKKYS